MTIESKLRACPPNGLADARNMTHKAIQGVTRAARANIPAVPDASHTNLVWDAGRGAFLTNPIAANGGAIAVGLVMSDLTLLLVRGDQTLARLDLAGVSVGDADDWLDSQLSNIGLSKPSSAPHPYELPSAVDEISVFSTEGMGEELASLVSWFALSDSIFQRFVVGHADISPGPSPVRCWPHHFDIATFVSLETGDFESASGIGVGLSPGDETYDEPYFYVNPWPHLDLNDLPALGGLGHWHKEGFVGAILTGSELLAAADLEKGAAGFVENAFAIGRRKLGL